eukprot:624257-Pelagomonas_calceolata.AAC.2
MVHEWHKWIPVRSRQPVTTQNIDSKDNALLSIITLCSILQVQMRRKLCKRKNTCQVIVNGEQQKAMCETSSMHVVMAIQIQLLRYIGSQQWTLLSVLDPNLLCHAHCCALWLSWKRGWAPISIPHHHVCFTNQTAAFTSPFTSLLDSVIKLSCMYIASITKLLLPVSSPPPFKDVTMQQQLRTRGHQGLKTNTDGCKNSRKGKKSTWAVKSLPISKIGKEDTWGRNTKYPLHQGRKKSMGVRRDTSGTPCLILLTKVERSLSFSQEH